MTRGTNFLPKVPKERKIPADVPVFGPLTFEQWFKGEDQTRRYDQQTDIFDPTNAYHVSVFGPLTWEQYKVHVSQKLQEEWNHIDKLYQTTIALIQRTGGWRKENDQIRRRWIPNGSDHWCGICEEVHDRYYCKILLGRQSIACFRCNKFGHWSPNCQTKF